MPPIAKSVHELLQNNHQKWSPRDYVWTKIGSSYQSKTYGELIEDSWALASALIKKGHKGDRIVIMSDNSYSWMVIDLALMGYVGVSVGANKDWLEHDLENCLKVTDAKAVLYDDQKSEMVKKMKKRFQEVKFISIEKDMTELVKEGRKILKKDPTYLIKHAQNSSRTCKIVFTSGSTALPKAVSISYENMIACGEGLYDRTPTDETDIYYLFLPLHHVYAGIGIFACSFFMGCQVYLSADIQDMKNELSESKPTVFCAVPLVYQKIYDVIDSETMKRIQKGIKLSKFVQMFGININSVLFKKLHAVFGGQTKYLFCGGANFSDQLKGFYKDVGLNIIEGYGLSETASMLAMEYPDSKKLGSVGKVFNAVNIKFVNVNDKGHGEIAVKGPNVMSGYFNNPQANRDTFDKDGYFHTGDIGYQDEDGDLHIVGRKDRVIIASNGENVSPSELEDLIKKHDKTTTIVKASVFEQNNEICARILTTKGTKLNAERLFREINSDLPRFKQIKQFTVSQVDVSSQIKN